MRRRAAAWGAWAVLSTVVAAAPASAQEAPGVLHTSTHYELTTYGDITPDDAAELLRLAEQLHGLLGKHFRAQPVLRRGQPRLQIQMWTTRDAFRTHALADGVPERLVQSGGVYWTGTRRAYFFRQPSPYATRHLWLHELTHQFHYHAVLNNGTPSIPSWYMEGIAEYFAYHNWDGTTLECGRSDVVCLEQRIPELRRKAQAGAFDPLAVLDGTVPSDYGTAWALVHYFLKGADPGTQKWFRSLEPKIWNGAAKSWTPKTLGRGRPEVLGAHLTAWTANVVTTWKIDWRHWDAVGTAIAGDSKVVALVRTTGTVMGPEAVIEADVQIGAGRAGVCAAYASTENFVAFDCTADGKARLVRRQAGKWQTLAHGETTLDGPPTLKLTIQADGTCIGSIDGAAVITTRLADLNIQGHVALLNEAGRSTFDKIILPRLKQP